MALTHETPATSVLPADLQTACFLLEQTFADEGKFPGSPIDQEMIEMNLDHVQRVRMNAAEIAAGEGLDLNLMELAAILHDVSKLDHRETSSGGLDTWHHHDRGASLAKKMILVHLGKKLALADRVAQIIVTHSDIPFIRRFWDATYHASPPSPKTIEQLALRDADVIDMLWVGGMSKIIHFRQVPGSDFFKEDGGDIQRSISSARRSFEEASRMLSLKTARYLALERIDNVQSFFASLVPVRNMADFHEVYDRFLDDHQAATPTHAHRWQSK